MNGSGIQDIVGNIQGIKGLFKKRKKKGRDLDRDEDNTPSFKRGGKMKRRGIAKLHKGERVVRGRGRSR